MLFSKKLNSALLFSIIFSIGHSSAFSDEKQNLLNGDIFTKLEKLDGTTRVIGETKAIVFTKSTSVWRILTDPKHFKEINSQFDLSRELDKKEIDKVLKKHSNANKNILEEKFQLIKEVDASKNRISNIEQRFYYRRIDMPWPITNKWLIMRERINHKTINKDKLEIKFDHVVGSIHYYKAIWRIQKLENNKTLVHLTYDMDMGFNVPSFLISLGKNTNLPKSIKALRKLATNLN